MKTHTPSFHLGSKDEEFFYYLHQVKIATLLQINRDIYQYEKFKSLYKRISKFEKLGFLSQTSHVAFPKQKLITLSRKGFDQFVSNGDESVVELRSEAIAHDVALVDIRHCFLSSPKVIAFHTENSLQTWKNGHIEEEYRPYVEARCDASIKARFPSGELCLAVEYEASRKHNVRIKDVIAKYYNTEEIPAVLYVCQTQEIINRYIQEENRTFKDRDPKLYYMTIGDFFKNESLPFSDRDGARLRLGNKKENDGETAGEYSPS